MPRNVRDSAILAKIETTYGTDATPTGSLNAMLVSNQTVNPLNAQNVDRALLRPYLGASEQLVGTKYIELTFDVELQGSGTAGTAPAYGPLLRAAGMAEAVTVSSRVEYTPISAGFESATIYYYDSGVVHKMLGARGDVEIKAGVGEKPVLSFNFRGLDGGIAAASTPTIAVSNFKTPAVVTDANTSDILLGCTYAAGSLSGGTAYPSKGLSAKLGNSVDFIALVGGESIDITNREATAAVTLDLTAAQEITMMGNVINNIASSIGLTHGATAGYKVTIFAPAVQLLNPKKEDQSGRRMIGFDGRLLPSAGNDELRLVVA
jgi:hypothetical protein